MTNLYGDVQQSNNSSTGIADGYCMTNFAINDRNSLELHFTKTFDSGKSITLRTWINPLNPKYVTPYGDDTQEVALQKAASKQNRLIKQLVTNFVPVEDYEAHLKGFQAEGGLEEQFVAFINHVAELLPDNFAETQGRLVVGYDKNGYLSSPNRLGWDAAAKRYRPFFSVDADTVLMELPPNLTLEKPVPDNTAVEADVADDF